MSKTNIKPMRKIEGIEEEDLRRMYEEDINSVINIADYYGVSTTVIYKGMDENPMSAINRARREAKNAFA